MKYGKNNPKAGLFLLAVKDKNDQQIKEKTGIIKREVFS
jgi:hypothetical protein